MKSILKIIFILAFIFSFSYWLIQKPHEANIAIKKNTREVNTLLIDSVELWMSCDEVKSILGEPEKIVFDTLHDIPRTIYVYPTVRINSKIYFDTAITDTSLIVTEILSPYYISRIRF